MAWFYEIRVSNNVVAETGKGFATHKAAIQAADFVCHSERSEESLPIENKRPRGILRANSALRMTVFHFFPQPV